MRAHAENFNNWVKEADPDVILVQELKCVDCQFPHILFDHLGYNIKVFGQKSWNGVAVFSKYSIEDVTRGLPNYPDENSRYMECLIDGRVRIINVYMPNGEAEDSPKFPYKIEWMEAFTNHISHLLEAEEPVVIGGDYNVALFDRDIWNPAGYKGSSISAPAARKIMQKWIDAGWVDAFRHVNPDAEKAYTWWGYRMGGFPKNHGLLLDYFLVNKAALPLIKNCWIDKGPRGESSPSDHTPLVLEIV